MLLNSQSAVSVAIPINATPTERFAADELKKYINKIFNIEPSITNDSALPAGQVFVIGNPCRNKLSAQYITEAEFDVAVPGPEGIFIKDFGADVILIAGSSKNLKENDRGTLYGVYEFLERYLGCTLAAFSNPNADVGEIVPRCKEINLSDIYFCKKSADCLYRTAIVQYSNWAGNPERELNIPFFDWLAKNRYNRILTWSSVYEYYKKTGLLEEAIKRGIVFTVGHHESSRLFLPDYGNDYFPEHYYETHPEYYKLLKDGSRFSFEDHDGQWVFCSRNEDAIKTVAQNINLWLKENPFVDTVAFWPNDGMSEHCCCDMCSKYSKTENYCYFINSVARLAKQKHPHIKFDMLIYVDLWDCPEGMVMEDNIIIDESTWHKDGLRFFGKPDGTCLNGTHFEDNILKWKNAGANVVYYDYYMGVYGLKQRLIPMADEVQSIWQNFAQKGIEGAGTQIECYNMWNHLFNFYTFGRTGYDSSLSFEDNLSNFSKLFGEGSEVVSQIIKIMEDCVDGQPKMHDCGHYLMENIDKEKIYDLYETALSKAETPRSRNNIRMLRMVFRYTDIETQDPISKTDEFNIVEKRYADSTGELNKMSEFDSFWKNNPGYGIMIPVDSNNTYEVNDKWYNFE